MSVLMVVFFQNDVEKIRTESLNIFRRKAFIDKQSAAVFPFHLYFNLIGEVCFSALVAVPPRGDPHFNSDWTEVIETTTLP